MVTVFIILCIICVLCVIISIYRFRTEKCRISKELKNLSEEHLWKQWSDTHSRLYGATQRPNSKERKLMMMRHWLIVEELKQRDLLALEPIKERDFADSLKDRSDLLVCQTFLRQWELLNKNCENPRLQAIWFSLAREELIKRYRCKYAQMPEKELKESFSALKEKYFHKYIPRDKYEEFLVAQAEMGNRHFLT